MEKLVLKGIMYGADKVPDSWFEKVPGGYYKPNPPAPNVAMRARQSHTRFDDGRRYSDDYSRVRPQDNPSRYSRHRSQDKREDGRRSRSSYDRYDDNGEDDPAHYRHNDHQYSDSRYDDRYYNEGPRARRQRRRPRYQDDDDYDEGQVDRQDASRPAENDAEHGRPISPFTAAAAAVAGVTAAQAARDIKSPTPQDPPAEQYTGYVPYSDIYGEKATPVPPPPQSNTGSVQPTHTNQVATSRHNPMNPDSSTAGGVVSTHYAQRQQPYDDRFYDDRYYDDRYYEPDDDDDDYYYSDRRNSRPSRPPMRRRSHGDSYDSRDAPRRPSNADGRSSLSQKLDRVRGKSMSRVKDTFDKSERGLGYGAVGALAGGLIGSEYGKGAVPAAIGAVVGGLGANIFEARERSVCQVSQQSA